MSRRVVNYLAGFLSLLLGFVLYLLFRENTYVSELFAWLPFIENVRQMTGGMECDFLRFYFPDYLWGLSLGCFLQGVFDGSGKGAQMCALAAFSCGVVWEIMQWIGIVKGTADMLDVLMYFLAGVTCLIFNCKEKRKA